ncbi:MAG: histidine phosphatase family protein [Armatimonadetes bacterium]|nr:histidine phosphatase family protein [Armatimonadota bacterium]
MVVLVRHGQTLWNISNRAQGHIDIELDETGHKQAQLLANRLCELQIDKVFTSDLKRCLQTIQPFCERGQPEVQMRPDLRERTFGDMEGADYVELHAWMREEGRRLGVPDYEVRPPNGESMLDVWARLDGIVQELRDVTKNVLVVSHGGALAQLLARLMYGTHETPRMFRFSNCSVTTLNRREDRSFMLGAFNDCCHLEATNEAPKVG